MRLFFASLTLVALLAPSQEDRPVPSAAALTAAINRGTLAWQLSETDEVRAVLGDPKEERSQRDGGMELRLWTYNDIFMVAFAREFGTSGPFVLIAAQDNDRRIGPAPGAKLALRTAADLARLRPFTGLQNVDVSRLDLRTEEARLRALPFDTRTVWPAADRLPRGFDPTTLLAEGRNPGLGLRALHARAIDGRGVTIGIIDQPLVRDHAEIAGRLDIVAELEVPGVPPQMHGPAVTSLAAGATCGVAPGARIAFVSMAMWKAQSSNALYIQALERLLELNTAGTERVRAVSISYGGFETAAQATEWAALLAKAEAQGVLVITCDLGVSQLEYGLAAPIPGGDREKPEGYTKGSYGRGLLVPGDGRTFAGPDGPAEYSAPKGGMSWGAPYLAGLAALGFQVNPNLTPVRVRAYLLKSATRMPYGQLVNPEGFVKLCRDDPDAGPVEKR